MPIPSSNTYAGNQYAIEFLDKLRQRYYAPGNDAWNTGHVDPGAFQYIQRIGDEFKQLFRNFVGRDPSGDEIGTAFQLFGGGTNINNVNDPLYTQQALTSFIGSNYGRAAQEQAALELENQRGSWQKLADLFRGQGTTAIDSYQQSLNQNLSDTEKSLIDFRDRLFEKIQPNLLTSLQAQGLNNTGGANEAFAGVAKDLADSAQEYIAGARTGIGQDIAGRRLENDMFANQIAQGAETAPLEARRNFSLGNVPNLLASGQNALQNVFGQFAADQDLRRQESLMRLQARLQEQMQPSFFRTFSQGFGGGFGQSLGSNLGAWAAPKK